MHIDTLNAFLKEIANEIKTYGNIILEFDSSTDDSYTEHYTKVFLKKPFNKLQPLNMNIGTMSLVEHADGDYLQDEDVVNIIWAIYHERTHVIDHMAEYNNIAVSDDVKNAAKVEVVADYMTDFRYYAEQYFPSELKAEREAFVLTDEYFRIHDTNIDYKNIILNKINANGYKFLRKSCDNYEKIYDCLQDRYEKSFYDLRLGMLWNYPLESRCSQLFVNSEEMTRQIVYNPTNGLEETETAIKYILEHKPIQFGAYKCLHEEYALGKFYKLRRRDDRELPEIDYVEDKEPQDEKQ